MLSVGDTFPAFALKAVKAGPEGLKLDTAFVDIASDTDAGKWKLVFFWPKDFRLPDGNRGVRQVGR